jgi:4-aminobutyrate--pyruvate transaminase
MGDSIALAPPFIIEPTQLRELVSRLTDALNDVNHATGHCS